MGTEKLERACVVGGGRSAIGVDFSRLTGLVVGLNQAALELQGKGARCDVLFSQDPAWCRRHVSDIEGFLGEVHLCYEPKQDNFVAGAFWWRRLYEDMPTRELGALASGRAEDGCTGITVLNWLAHLDARKIACFGYDMDENNYGYWYEISGEDQDIADSHLSKPPLIRDNFERIAPWYAENGIEIVIANPDSKIECFPRMTPEETLQWIAS